MDPVEDLQHALDWYLSVVPERTDRPRSPTGESMATKQAIDAFRREIAPLELASELEWFWLSWTAYDLDSRFDVLAWPKLTRFDNAAMIWRQQRQGEFPGMPRNLLTAAYESHGYLLADLCASAEGQPAPLWLYAPGPYMLHYPSLAGLFRSTTSALEAAGVDVPADRSSWRPGESQEYREVLEVSRRAVLCTSGLTVETDEVSEEDQRTWPPAWQAASGFGPAEMNPRGVTHTAEELIASAAGGPLTARLHGRVHGNAGPFDIGDGWFSVRTFTDSTGSIDVLQPAGFYGVGVTTAATLEIEVECVGPFPPPSATSTSICSVLEAAATDDSEGLNQALDDWVAARFPEIARLPRIVRMVAV